jgi:hypothetical protein
LRRRYRVLPEKEAALADAQAPALHAPLTRIGAQMHQPGAKLAAAGHPAIACNRGSAMPNAFKNKH